MNEITIINNKPLTVKEYQGQRVVTFRDVDELHERPDGTAGRNFRENKKRFMGAIDYFELTQPDEIRRLGIERPQGGTPEKVILLTESGYLMLAKSLNDDLAWLVQRELVNNYFRNKQPIVDISRVTAQVSSQIMMAMSQSMFKLEERITELEARLEAVQTHQLPPVVGNDVIADEFFDVLRQALRDGYYLSGLYEKAPEHQNLKLLGAVRDHYYFIISQVAYDLYLQKVDRPLTKHVLYACLEKNGYIRREDQITGKRIINDKAYRSLVVYRSKVVL
jgi:hypothetical protein